jgi:hypothetical protein
VFGARAIAAHLAQFRPVVYTRDMDLSEREAAIRTFKEDPSHAVLIRSLRAGGVGLNLQDAESRNAPSATELCGLFGLPTPIARQNTGP